MIPSPPIRVHVLVHVLVLVSVLAACKKKPAPAPEGPTGPTFAYVPLKDCTCQADVTGQGKERIDVRLAVSMQGGAMTWRLERPSTQAPGFELAPSTGMAPPTGDVVAPDQALGLGCDGPIVVVAANQALSGWSVTEHRLLWSRSLGADYAPPPRAADAAGHIVCQPLSVTGGQVAIPVAGGKIVSARMADGAGELAALPTTPVPTEPPDASELDGR